MLRPLHSWPGLVAALLVIFMALTGAILALQPAIERAQSGAASQMSVAALAEAVAAQLPGVERIVQTASGAIIAYGDPAAGPAAVRIDPATGSVLSVYEPSPFFSAITELHRSLLLGTGGHAVAGVSALAMLMLAVSGAALLVGRLGGWRKLLGAARGTLFQRLHVEIGRMAVIALLLIGITGGYLSLVNFGLIETGMDSFGAFPTSVDGGTPAPVGSLSALLATPMTDLRELVFPFAGDPSDVFTLTTSAGQGFVDQATGALLDFAPNGLGQKIYEIFFMLHTGRGAWWLGLILGLAALGVPAMALSGIVIWWKRRASQPKLVGNVGPRAADTVILVGSEGNSTWGFAAALHKALTDAGHKVHTAPMNAVGEYVRARHLLVLAATYGDGSAPASANRFLDRITRIKPRPDLKFSVLGFGDRSFAHYCQFALDAEAALQAQGWQALQPMASIDRQSSQAFAQWTESTGQLIGTPLSVAHVAARPRTVPMALIDRQDFGMEVQAPTSVLRFGPVPRPAGWLARLLGRDGRPWPRFEAGDLVGILPPGSSIPRYYSLASSSEDGALEICVRKHVGGLCSEFLQSLEPGGSIDAFIKTNPAFRPAGGRTPVVMIGAGTGIAPLAGFVRHNNQRQPYFLYWGGRDPDSDFLYEGAMREGLAEGRLSRLVTAFSRVCDGAYVQDRLREDADILRDLVARGAQVMVCGGKDMALGVREALDEILLPIGATAQSLKANGRYLEDVY